VHFFEISDDGITFFPRVRSPEVNPSAPPELPDERVTSGAPGLDEMLGGGIPRASTTVIQGGTGTGKTLLGLQYLVEGARHGEPGIHFSLEETTDQLRSFARKLGWNLGPLEERGLLTFRYVSPVELSTDIFLDRARQEVKRLGVKRAVLDSLTSMELGVPSQRRFKELVYALTKHFHESGVSLQMNMEIADLLGTAQLSGHGISFAADNVIQLKYVEVKGRLERGISVLKARGVRHATDMRRLVIGKDRIDVGPAFTGMRGVLTGLPVPLGHET
jgi:circadian clock protein KaiC